MHTPQLAGGDWKRRGFDDVNVDDVFASFFSKQQQQQERPHDSNRQNTQNNKDNGQKTETRHGASFDYFEEGMFFKICPLWGCVEATVPMSFLWFKYSKEQPTADVLCETIDLMTDRWVFVYIRARRRRREHVRQDLQEIQLQGPE